MKKVIATFFICIVLGFISILGYAIFLNSDGITEAFINFPLPYLFWFIFGIFIGSIIAPIFYNRIKRFANSRRSQKDVDLE